MRKSSGVVGDLFPDIVDLDLSELTVPPRSPVEVLVEWRRSPEFAHLREKLFPTTSTQPADLISLLCHEGMEELTGPLTWAFRMLATHVHGEGSRRVVRVPVHRVLSHAWRPARIARNFELSATGTKPPPVDLTEVRFGREKFFLVSDGNHRCEVAKMKGAEFVLGRVEEVRTFDPEDFQFVRGGVRLRDGTVRKLEADQRAAARWLGVKAGKTMGGG